MSNEYTKHAGKVVVGFVCIGIIVWGNDLVRAFWQVEDTVEHHEEQINDEESGLFAMFAVEDQEDQETVGLLKELRQGQKMIAKLAFTKRGRASICKCGENEEFIKINTRGAADFYANYKKAMVTIGDNRFPMEIKGEVRGAVQGAMIELSIKAADTFGVKNHVGDIPGVVIEPIE